MGESENEQQYVALLKKMVLDTFNDVQCTIMLFGSRARGDFRRSSDYDIGFSGISRSRALQKIAVLDMIIEGSRIPHRVDWVFLDEVDPDFRAVVEKDAVLWKK